MSSPTNSAHKHEDPRPSDEDIYLFHEGTHERLDKHLGAHRLASGEVFFALWAPNAERVAVVGDFNTWTTGRHPMRPLGNSGIWIATIDGLEKGSIYKYRVDSKYNGYTADKADPFGIHHETPPRTGSRVWDLDYVWNDDGWMASRAKLQAHDAPISIYEVHLGSWQRHPDGSFLTYEQLAERLPGYVKDRGFTHVELMPVTEHPLYESWGYQTTGYFAPTSRYGTPQGFMTLVDALHRAGIGVILDWVPSHFPSDEHGLGYFDGTHLFEHADPKRGFHPDWKSLLFNYGRNEVRAFLISSAMFWLDVYHIDALRVDAVASMLYLDYSREPGEWIPNREGGREDLDAIAFLKQLNTRVYKNHPDVQTFAEESTAWPRVSHPVHDGGLGFGFKWDMGWMHDTLEHLARDPIERAANYNELTFRGMYMTAESYALPLSHDEVVHGKGSVLNKMWGDEWQRFANLRLLLANQWTQPGKKILFMGCEFAQRAEWNEKTQLEWDLLEQPMHRGVRTLIEDLNRLMTDHPALHELDCHPDGFRWLEADDSDSGVIAFLRLARDKRDPLLCVFNTTPVPRDRYVVGAPHAGTWREILNTDAQPYGGSGKGNLGAVNAEFEPHKGEPYRLTLALPPLAALVLSPEPTA
ncbi:MAG: 1,4-alpha-glucan branching protein GlgB [Phycisphaerales bacterium]